MQPLLLTLAILCCSYNKVSSSDLDSKRSSLRSEKNSEKTTFVDYTEAAVEDLILDLPGLDFEPNFKQFSGYLTISPETNKSIFYWYVESQSDPANDPVVFWTNGGPGCSGLLAFGSEHGPFYYSANGTLSENPFSWNTIANMLYVEQPAGVGFSYSDDDKDYITGDAQAAADNYMLIKQFFERFPERKPNDFYITSESYGGHYMPELANEIMEKNTDGSINFRGFAVGNPYVDPFSNDVTMYEKFYSHGLLSAMLFAPWTKRCAKKVSFKVGCVVLERLMTSELEPGINPYALDYPVCLDKNGNLKSDVRRRQSFQLMKHIQKFELMQKEEEEQSLTQESRRLEKYTNYKPCELDYFTDYLNRKDVREAIHVRDEDTRDWEDCSSIVQYSTDDSNKSLIEFYKKVISEGLKNNLNMMVFSGDDDSICSLEGTQYWIYDIGFDVVPGKLWKHWYDKDGQVAGYKTIFDNSLGTDGIFTFVTVHGAGHEVPAYKPEQSLEMFKTFLEKKW